MVTHESSDGVSSQHARREVASLATQSLGKTWREIASQGQYFPLAWIQSRSDLIIKLDLD